jgi:peptidoglycan/LPS O-acetylase OafA/YrhL
MIALRLLSLLAAALVLVVPPMVLFAPGDGDMPGALVAAGLLAVLLVSGSFVYVAVAARQMRRPGPERTLGCALLVLPALASLVLLATYDDPAVLWSSGILLVVTAVVYLSVAFPAMLSPRQRPMRERERQEPVIVRLPRRG